MPFGVVVVGNKEGKARKESADEEAKIRGPLQSSSAAWHFLSELLGTVLLLRLMFSYRFLNMA